MPEAIAQEERRQSQRHEIPILPPILIVNNGAGLDFRDCRFTGVGAFRNYGLEEDVTFAGLLCN
jgi:hypothetical protein